MRLNPGNGWRRKLPENPLVRAPYDEDAKALISVLFPNPEALGIHYRLLVDAFLSYKASNREQAFELSEEDWKRLRKRLQTAP
jgi:hypothetical protein